MPATLRIELFPTDITQSITFYTQILRFNLLQHKAACITTPHHHHSPLATRENPGQEEQEQEQGTPPLEPYAYLSRAGIFLGLAEKKPQLTVLANSLYFPSDTNSLSTSTSTSSSSSVIKKLNSLRQPPLSVELVLEVDDLLAERDHIVGQGWPLEANVAVQDWGLRDFRLVDGDGYYWRVTERGGDGAEGGLEQRS